MGLSSSREEITGCSPLTVTKPRNPICSAPILIIVEIEFLTNNVAVATISARIMTANTPFLTKAAWV